MYIYGKNVAKEKLNTNEPIKKAYISKKFKDQSIIDSLLNRNVRINLLCKIAFFDFFKYDIYV